MSLRIPQLQSTLSPNVSRHPPPPGVMHTLELPIHAWQHVRKLLLHLFVVLLSIFLSTFVISGWLQIVCVAMATVMIPTFQISIPSKLFSVFICVLLVCSRPILDAYVCSYDEFIRKEFLRQFVFSATAGHFLDFAINVTAAVISNVCVRMAHLLPVLYQVLEEAETCQGNGRTWDQAEVKARTDECFNRNNEFVNSDTVAAVTAMLGNAISAGVTPVLLVSGYNRATRTGGLEVGANAEIILKWAVTSAMGLFLSTRVIGCLWWYPAATQQTRDSHINWKTIAGSVIHLVRLGLVQAGVFLYVGSVKAEVNSCFKCMSWTWVLWYLWSFTMIRELFQWAQKNLCRETQKSHSNILSRILGFLLFLVICASFLADAVFLYNVYSTLRASEA